MQRIEVCSKCDREFYRKFVSGKISGWSRMNDVYYWTDGKGWRNYKTLCRSCLLSWRKDNLNDFKYLISPTKRKAYFHYQKDGTFGENDLVLR